MNDHYYRNSVLQTDPFYIVDINKSFNLMRFVKFIIQKCKGKLIVYIFFQ